MTYKVSVTPLFTQQMIRILKDMKHIALGEGL